MAKKTHKLTALQVKKLSMYGFYPDGGGLYLQVSKTGSKAWVYRYESNGKGRKQGLGSTLDVSLNEARVAASVSRKLRHEGKDPIDEKRKKVEAARLKSARGLTFKDCATSFVEAHKAGWTNSKHCAQWSNSLVTHAYPTIGQLPVQDIDVTLVMKVLEPIWLTKTETATRVRQRIENILDWAKAREYRSGENPARWRGHLDMLLPKPSKVRKVKHFNAMPFVRLPDYFLDLRKKDSLAAKALAFIILTATRSNETRSATWSEIDLDGALWIIPENRMKAKKEHRVPLSTECLQILKEAKKYKVNDFVFPGLHKNAGITEAALRKILRRDQPDATIHGFRSSFRDWCAEMTSYDSKLAEFALAHQLSDATEAAYLRSKMVDKRRKLMNDWSKYCVTKKQESSVIFLKTRS